MEQNISLKQREFSQEEVENAVKAFEKLHGASIPKSDHDNLGYGEKTTLLQDLKIQDGQEQKMKDAKLQLSRDRDGSVKVNYHFKKPVLEIPKMILNKELSKKEEEELKAGKSIGPIKKEGKNYFVAIDKELNTVTVMSDKEVGIKKEIGGYEFTDRELEKLSNGEKISAKVYKGEQGYFMAELSKTADNRGITFHEIKPLSPEKAMELMETLNKHPEKNFGMDAVNIASNFKTEEMTKNAEVDIASNFKTNEQERKVDIQNTPKEIPENGTYEYIQHLTNENLEKIHGSYDKMTGPYKSKEGEEFYIEKRVETKYDSLYNSYHAHFTKDLKPERLEEIKNEINDVKNTKSETKELSPEKFTKKGIEFEILEKVLGKSLSEEETKQPFYKEANTTLKKELECISNKDWKGLHETHKNNPIHVGIERIINESSTLSGNEKIAVFKTLNLDEKLLKKENGISKTPVEMPKTPVVETKIEINKKADQSMSI